MESFCGPAAGAWKVAGPEQWGREQPGREFWSPWDMAAFGLSFPNPLLLGLAFCDSCHPNTSPQWASGLPWKTFLLMVPVFPSSHLTNLSKPVFDPNSYCFTLVTPSLTWGPFVLNHDAHCLAKWDQFGSIFPSTLNLLDGKHTPI